MTSPGAPGPTGLAASVARQAIDLGGTRGICVGTQEKCDADRKAKLEKVPTGLDMLINFNLDSADLTPEARTKLGEFAKALKDNRLSQSNFVIEGHTDATGSAKINRKLSKDRAKSVMKYLAGKKVAEGRMVAKGFGPDSPIASNDDEAGREQNRRVEFNILKQGPKKTVIKDAD